MANVNEVFSGVDNIIDRGIEVYSKVQSAKSNRTVLTQQQQLEIERQQRALNGELSTAEKVGIGLLVAVGLVILFVVLRKEL